MDRRRRANRRNLEAETPRQSARLMQSAYAIGEAIAALVVGSCCQLWLARVFLVGVFRPFSSSGFDPAWPEPTLWSERRSAGSQRPPLAVCSRQSSAHRTAATAMNTCGLFGYWACLPGSPRICLSRRPQGGRGLSLVKTTTFFLVLCAGKFVGYAAFGFLADAFGRRKPYFTLPANCRRTRANLRKDKQPNLAALLDLSWHSLERDFLRVCRDCQRNLPR